MFEAIVSQAQFAICLREKMCGIDQCSSSAALGRVQHTEMFVDHVTVFSQSVSHIRLSQYNTLLYLVTLLYTLLHNVM